MYNILVDYTGRCPIKIALFLNGDSLNQYVLRSRFTKNNGLEMNYQYNFMIPMYTSGDMIREMVTKAYMHTLRESYKEMVNV